MPDIRLYTVPSDAASRDVRLRATIGAATANITEAADTLSSAVGVRVTGTLNATEAAQTLTASGTVTGGASTITGTLNVTETADTLTALGTVAGAIGGQSGLRPGGIGHKRPHRHLTIFPAPPEPEAPPPVPAVDEPAPLPRKLKTKARKAAVAEIRKFAVAFIERTDEPSLSDVMDRILAEARYQAFLAERANYERVQATIARLVDEAANDDEEAALMLLVA